ncbi:PQQ-like beta-propeller repeat protein [Catellatospora sp. NEAU-YM18]|nr:PQQ-like beta-propeller repeat protein [Catellatospora tritici]
MAVTAVLGALLAPLAGAAALTAPVNPKPTPSVTFNGEVHATTYWGDTIYVGGDFTSATVGGSTVKRSHAAAVNARTGALLPWNPQVDAMVRAIATDGDGVYLAGDFHAVNGVSRDSLAAVSHSGVLQSTFKHNISNGRPYDVSVGGGRLYLGGSFTVVDGHTRLGVAAFDLATGALDPNWNPKVNDVVRAVLYTPGRVYLGGRFSSVNSLRGTAKIAAVDPANGAVDPGFFSHVSAMVHDIAVSGDTVYAGIDGTGGRASAMDTAGTVRWTVTTDGDVQAIAVLDDVVYLGGHYDNVCRSAATGPKGVCIDGSIRRVKLAAVSASTGNLLTWTANGNGSVGVIALRASKELGQVVAGGAYTAVNGSPQRRFALFNLVSPAGLGFSW